MIVTALLDGMKKEYLFVEVNYIIIIYIFMILGRGVLKKFIIISYILECDIKCGSCQPMTGACTTCSDDSNNTRDENNGC